MANFYDMIMFLQEIGVADVILPFFLVFTIVFAIFQKSKILGEPSKVRRFNLIIALVLAFSFVMPHVVWGTVNPTDHMLTTGIVDPVEIVNGSIPNISVVVIAVILVMLLLGVFGHTFDMDKGGLNSLVFVFVVGTVGYIFLTNAGYFGGGQFPEWLWFLRDPNTQSLLVVILVFGAIVWGITHEDTPKVKMPVWLKGLDSDQKKAAAAAAAAAAATTSPGKKG